jgi:hypothetical protein
MVCQKAENDNSFVSNSNNSKERDSTLPKKNKQNTREVQYTWTY